MLLLQIDQHDGNTTPSDLTCAEHLWPLLRTGSNTRLRTYLLHRLGTVGVEPDTLVQQLEIERDVVARRALLLSLGRFASPKLPVVRRWELAPKLLPMYRDDPDPGLHSAVEWLLRKWSFGEELDTIDRDLAGQSSSDRRWYVNGQGHTLAVVSNGPVEFQMGSLARGLERQADHALHTQQIPHSFALATKEVTVQQFSEFLRACPDIQHDRASTRKYSPEPDGPVLGVTWFDAARYCRWLSEQEGIPAEQMCYPPIAEIRPGMRMPPDYLARTGYRLPTEAEWEYACRAGAATSRHCGQADEMLGHYAWYVGNSQNRTWSVASKMPNDYGLFDMYGNVWEWCQDSFQVIEDRENANEGNRVVRGGAFLSPASNARSASRSSFQPNLATHPESGPIAVGLRVARTLPH